MKKKFFGAALFFIGLGILFTLLFPIENWFLRLVCAMGFMLIGYKIGSCGF